MADRIFLRLSEKYALGADDLQWIVYRSRARFAPDLDRRHWLAIAFVSSTREILARCVRESGFGDDTALSAVSMLPSTFGAWKAAKSSSAAAPEHELEHA